MAVFVAAYMRCAALAWYLGVASGDAATLRSKERSGRLLLQRLSQTPPLVPAGVSQEATAHIFTNIAKLKQEAANAVAQESSLITGVALRKEQEAREVIEKEIPLASQNDTQEVTKDVAEHRKGIDAAMQRSTQQAKEALEALQDRTANAINMSTQYKVRQVEMEAEESAMLISNHSVELQAEAEALTKEAKGAANFSQQAAKNSELWVKELPVKEAADAVSTARKAEAESIQLRHEYDDTKRMAKLAGNLALDTLRISKLAAAKAEKAKQEATETAEQAAQNALLLNTIRTETKKAEQASMSALGK